MAKKDIKETGTPVESRHFVNVGWKHPGVAGFISVDIEFDENLSRELSEGFPFDDSSIEGVLCEDLIHRLPRPDGLNLLRACRRVMSTDATLRIATMDLESITRSYTEMVREPDKFEPGRPCELLNNLFQAHSSKWIYDEAELIRLAQMAGLEFIGRQTPKTSTVPAFEQLDTYPHCDLILEFRRFRRDVPEDPLVSVLIPAVRPTFFREALRSAVEQSWKNLEVIVLDDSEGTEISEICESFSNRSARIRYIRGEGQETVFARYCQLIEHSEGDYIKFLSDDDVLHDECVERLARCLQAYSWVSLATSHRQAIDVSGEAMLRRGIGSRLVFEDSVVDGTSAANLMLEMHSRYIGGLSAVLFRKADLIDEADGLLGIEEANLGPLSDIVLWMKLLSKGDLVYLVQSLGKYRQHPQQAHRQFGYEERADLAWTHLQETGRRLGYLVDGVRLNLNCRPLATRPWWTPVVVRVYREASELVGQKGLAGGFDSLLKLNALLPDEPWPPVVLAESLLATESPEKALKVMSPTLSQHRDYFPAYALSGAALACLGKNDAAAALFAEGCVWALPVLCRGGTPGDVAVAYDLNKPRSFWIHTGRFRFGISFRVLLISVPSGTSLPVRLPVLVNDQVVVECSFYGSGDSTSVTLESPPESTSTVVRLGPVLRHEGEEEIDMQVRVEDFNVVLLGRMA